MKINEELSVLFWLKKTKMTKEGLIPIWVRITIKGIREEFSSGKKLLLKIGMRMELRRKVVVLMQKPSTAISAKPKLSLKSILRD